MMFFTEKPSPKQPAVEAPPKTPDVAVEKNLKTLESKFKTPSRKNLSDDSSQISEISEQDDGDEEFGKLWANVEIKHSEEKS